LIPNHQSPRLSELDLKMARAVPPGGNWRDIPLEIPSERLAQIRVSAAAGEGSRSTYYGRLRPDEPSYTIGTYYNRPGNGCFLHPDPRQHRTISHREAARLQSFPDAFLFEGPQRSICQQIGNAVPPLLSFQVALALEQAGDMIDVFAGAGGLSLGFKWAGWRTLAATDIDSRAVSVFNRNVEPLSFQGDMEDDATLASLVAAAGRRDRSRPLAIVGGPPCQGFSTGGKRRSETDERNLLHHRYAELLDLIRPDLFVFENVLGLLSLAKGKFLERVTAGMRAVGYDVALWRLNAAAYGVPQRRQRVMLVGVPAGQAMHQQPQAWCALGGNRDLLHLSPAISVQEAIGDLPVLEAGADGSSSPYRAIPLSNYQALMRGQITPFDYLGRHGLDVGRLAA